MSIRIKRVYEAPEAGDGARILVDRLWPRGLSKEKAALTDWMKEVAPSTELRKWFDHDPERWAEFQERYRAELKDNPAVEALRQRAAHGTVTLLYGARDTRFNDAVVLADVLKR